MKRLLPGILATLAILTSAFAAPDTSDALTVALWPDGRAPINADGSETESADVSLLVFRPDTPNGTAMLVCAGGGYGRNLWHGAEGVRTARWLNEHGVTAAVLKYRLPKGNRFRPLTDVRRAVQTVRSKADAWNINPQRIGIIGYSAGGHLASMAATKFVDGNTQASDPATKLSSRPDFAVLVYPVITMGADTHAGSRKNLLGPNPSDAMVKSFSSELQVTAQTPPTFLAHAIDDKLVPPSNSRKFHEAMIAHKAQSKFLELPNGGHGLSGYKGPSWETWKSGSLAWMREIGVLPPKPGGPLKQ